ncbi:hypothetical protein Thermo_00942 [Thermoplasmatales archaeon]|nr:hypothetical protein Thermo_00942 [Thermoplasmatales archaeon]
MPFEDQFQTMYCNVIKPVVESLGYSVSKADEDLSIGNVIEQIQQSIRDERLVVADAAGAAGSASLSVGLGTTAAAVFAITDALVTSDLLNHPDGPYYTIYDEFGVDFTNTSIWEFWALPPNFGFYGEFGAKVGAAYSGSGVSIYYPVITSYLLPKSHCTFMPYY